MLEKREIAWRNSARCSRAGASAPCDSRGTGSRGFSTGHTPSHARGQPCLVFCAFPGGSKSKRFSISSINVSATWSPGQPVEAPFIPQQVVEFLLEELFGHAFILFALDVELDSQNRPRVGVSSRNFFLCTSRPAARAWTTCRGSVIMGCVGEEPFGITKVDCIALLGRQKVGLSLRFLFVIFKVRLNFSVVWERSLSVSPRSLRQGSRFRARS